MDYALDMARKLMPKANHREQLLIQAAAAGEGHVAGRRAGRAARRRPSSRSTNC